MPLLAPDSLIPCGAPLRRRCRIVAGIAILLAAPTLSQAQLYQSHTDDAAAVPKGMVRLKVTTSWTRFDERFTATGRRMFADEISSAALGVNEFPLLAPAEQALQTLTKDATTKLSFGRLAAESDARIVRTPIAVEYGLTRRLTIGFSVPIVQTRRSIAVRVNQDSSGNVGFVPERLRQAAADANNAVYTGFTKAADSLASLVSRCPASPNAAGCAAVMANTADATAASQAARQFANAVKAGLGTDVSTALIAPLGAGTLAARIDAQRTALNASVQRYLGASAGAATSVFGAPTPFSYIDLQGRNGVPGFLQSALGGQLDSIQTRDRPVVGGITVGAQLLVFDNFATDTIASRGIQTRLAVGGAYRFEPVFLDSATRLGTIPVGEGSAVELHSALDVIASRFGATIAARYAHPFAQMVSQSLLGDPEAFYPVPVFGAVTTTAGATIGLDVTPRILLGDWFTLDAHYGLERTGATTYDRPAAPCANCSSSSVSVVPSTDARTAQRAGFGIRYSTVDAYGRGATRLPIEISFLHLETFSGDAGVAKIRRDQLQMRLFSGSGRTDAARRSG
ncbi:MAG: hypothetical protein ABIY52_10190 [Gemmatimonadaceae bacterium]